MDFLIFYHNSVDIILLWEYNLKRGADIMIKRIYHGSKDIIKKPEYGKGKPYNDYGLGFYCTESIELAKEWGVTYKNDGYANIYDIDITGFNVLDLNSEQYCILHWLAVLLNNRIFDLPSGLAFDAREYILKNFLIDYSKADIMVGYRADDSYFAFAQDFINGTISYRQLNIAMHLGKLGQQFVLKSKEAFDRIQFVDYEIAECKEWYAKKEQRDSTAKHEYKDKER